MAAEDSEKKASETAGEAAAPSGEAEKSAEAAADAPEGTEATASEPEVQPTDEAAPEAIAKRVAALGEEDELDRIARIEEEKLAERRAKQGGKKGGKKGLDVAASKRLAEIGKKKAAAGTPSRAVPQDPVLQKTNDLAKWAKDNKGLVGGVVAAAVLVIGGIVGKEAMERRTESKASELLAAAVADQRGRVGDTPDDPDAPDDPTPTFKTAAERRDAALAKYRDVQTKFPGTGAAFLAKLSEGSLLLDKRDADGAAAAFSAVRGSPLATADAEVRGRALEGLGFAYELKAQGGDAAKLDEAAKVFRELENTDVKGFKELGMYHQARVFEAKGDKDKAKELLKSLRERVNKPGESHPFPYLETVAEDRLRALDPSALPPKQPNFGAGGPSNKMSDAQMRKMIEQMQKQMKEAAEKKGHGHP